MKNQCCSKSETQHFKSISFTSTTIRRVDYFIKNNQHSHYFVKYASRMCSTLEYAVQYSVLESTMSSLESNEKRMEWKKYVGQCTSIENKNKYSILDVHTYIFVCRKTCILSPNQNYFILLRVYSILVFILIAQIQLNVLLVIRVYRTPRLVLLELRLWIGPRDR